jgi:hypothetical protein
MSFSEESKLAANRGVAEAAGWWMPLSMTRFRECTQRKLKEATTEEWWYAL